MDEIFTQYKTAWIVGSMLIVTLLIMIIFYSVTQNLSSHITAIGTGLSDIAKLGESMKTYLSSYEQKLTAIEKHLKEASDVCVNFLGSGHR